MSQLIYLVMQKEENATEVNAYELTAKSDLANLKAKVDKIDADKLKIVPVDLSKLGDVGNNDVAKKLCIINWWQK